MLGTPSSSLLLQPWDEVSSACSDTSASGLVFDCGLCFFRDSLTDHGFRSDASKFPQPLNAHGLSFGLPSGRCNSHPEDVVLLILHPVGSRPSRSVLRHAKWTSFLTQEHQVPSFYRYAPSPGVTFMPYPSLHRRSPLCDHTVHCPSKFQRCLQRALI